MSVRILIVGAGKMSREHLAAFRACPAAEIVAIVSRGGDSARRLAAEQGVVHAGADIAEAARASGATAAIVAADHMSSESIVELCLSLGLHVLAEKPVTLTSAAAERLASLAAQTGLVACAGVNRRFYPGLLEGFLRLSTLGPMHQLSVVAPDCPEQRRALGRQLPAVCDQWLLMNTIHAIDLVRMLAGEVVSACGTYRHRRPDHDSIAAHLLTDRGVQVMFSVPGGPNLPWSLRLTGEGGCLIAEPFEIARLSLGRPGDDYPLPAREPAGVKMGLHGQAMAFLNAVESGETPFPLSSLADHARTLALCERLLTLPENT